MSGVLTGKIDVFRMGEGQLVMPRLPISTELNGLSLLPNVELQELFRVLGKAVFCISLYHLK